MPNPYAFVPLAGRVERRRPLLHHRLDGWSGILNCTLTALTPLFTSLQGGRSQDRLDFARRRGQPVIPGSGLKGVLRCVAEAASLSCIRLSGELFDFRGRLSGPYNGRLDTNYVPPCTRRDQLCPACRIFGMVGGQEGEVFRGAIAVSDGLPRAVEFAPQEVLLTLMNPRPRHQAFYLQSGHIRGRKFYFHRPLGIVNDAVKSRYNKWVKPVQPGSAFTFRVTCDGLAEDDLGLLLYALALEGDMAHKVGMGKPLGLGSARIEIVEAIPRQPFGAQRESLTGQALADWLAAKTRTLRLSTEPHIAALRHILTFRTSDRTDYRYPHQGWFKANPSVPLEKAP